MSDQTTAVMADVMQERKRQDDKWGGSKRDDQYDSAFWCDQIGNWFFDLRRTMPDETRRRLFIEIAALAVAGVESLDRKFPDA